MGAPVRRPAVPRDAHACEFRTQFNIESEELLFLREELDGWRQQISQTLRLDVFVDTADSTRVREAVGAQAHEPRRVLLERWSLRYEPAAALPERIAWPAFYKRFMVLLRSLLAFLPLMPAHRLVTSLSKLDAGAELSHQISVAPLGAAADDSFPAPLPPRQQVFAPPESQHGKLSLSVTYRCASLFERHPIAPSATNLALGGQFVPEYVSSQPHMTRAMAAAAAGEARRGSSPAVKAQLEHGMTQLAPPPSQPRAPGRQAERDEPRADVARVRHAPGTSPPAAGLLSASPLLGSTPPLPLPGVSLAHAALAGRVSSQQSTPVCVGSPALSDSSSAAELGAALGRQRFADEAAARHEHDAPHGRSSPLATCKIYLPRVRSTCA